MLRVVLDTNILVSGVLYIGKPKRVIDLALSGKIEIISSAETIDEFKRVIVRDKFRLSKPEQEAKINFVIRLSRIILVKSKFKVVKDDPDDDKFIQAAYDGKARYIVSGDHHLKDLKEFAGIKIVTASQLLELVE
jgi:putative PIN family toxin of toxin-antitoxin system